MRRIVLAGTVGGLLLTMCGCDSDDADPVAAPAATATTAVAAAEPTPAADYTADTKRVCNKADKLLEGKEMDGFAAQLGTMIVYKQAKQTRKADETRTKAQNELKALAAAMRAATATARDREVKAAGEEAATEIERTAASNAFFAKIKTTEDVNQELQSELVPWITPLAASCG
jgi:head-tail adaptor